MTISTKEMPKFLYKTIRIEYKNGNVEISQWCRCGREFFELETLGM